MVKKTKKNTVGEASKFINRSKAIKKLQVPLKDFRRLCILKGVYPRDPPKKLLKKGQTYYHIKDINFLNTERVLQKFREQKSHMKKVKLALVRGNKLKAKKLLKNKPKYSLNHLVIERYPSFIDALRDLDDPLCLINLISQFPTHKDLGIQRDKVEQSIKLMREFNLYCVKSHVLKKVFVSIKGIYYQCEIQGQTITWIQPHQLPANLPFDVDYRVMMTFLEFYLCLLKFVNYKLYKEKGWEYPPKFDQGKEDQSYFSYKTMILQNQQKNQQQELEDNKFKIDDEEDRFKENEDLIKLQQKSQEKLLFEGLGFWISPEVPKNSIEFISLSNGALVSWLGDPENIKISDKSITHIITDRSLDQIEIVKGKEYVQPQWIFDSINSNMLLPIKDYAVGKLLPPHLSPFLTQQNQNYLPERQKQIQKLINPDQQENLDENIQQDLDLNSIEQEELTDSEIPEPIQKKNLAMFQDKIEIDQGEQESYGLDEEQEENEEEENALDQGEQEDSSEEEEEEQEEEDSSDEEEEEEEEVQESSELSNEEAEEIQVQDEEQDEEDEEQPKYNYEKELKKKANQKVKTELEQKELAKKMMSRKNQTLYKQMHYKKNLQKEADLKLTKKAQVIQKKANTQQKK